MRSVCQRVGEIALDHQEKADRAGFDGFMAAECGTELVLFAKQRVPIVA